MNPQMTTSGSLLQGGSNTLQVTGNPQLAAGGLQPAVSPMGYTEFPSSTTTTTQTPTATTAPSGIQTSNLRSGITNLIGEAMGIYDALYGNLNTAAASQRANLENRYSRETGALGEQFTQEIPRIGQAYAGRGAYDSSWRTNAELAAKQGFENQLAALGEEKRSGMSKIGQEVLTNEAQFKAGQTNLNQLLGQLPNVTDVNELTTLQNQIQKQINDLKTQQAGLQSEQAYLQRFEQLTPSSDRMAQLSNTLSTIIAGEAPTPLKQSVAAQIIAGSGLTEQEKQQALTNFNAQLTAPAVA